MNLDWPIIGHQKIVKFLQKSIEQNKVSHAYLFYGPENLGKKTVAKYFSLSLICLNKNKPCFECEHCQKFLKDVYPDIIWVRKEEDKKNISIDQIRGLKERISLSGFTDSYKVVIIVNAEDLTEEAANSFLKILEEPPKKSVIILLANNLKNIPQTIASRCQLLKFSLVAKKEIFDHLKKEFKLSDKKAQEISSLALGRSGRAVKFTNHQEIFDGYLENQKKLIKIFESDINHRFKIIEQILKENDLKRIINDWKVIVRDLLLFKINCQELVINFFLEDKLKIIAEKISLEKIYQLEKELDNLLKYINQNINLKLALDNFVININD